MASTGSVGSMTSSLNLEIFLGIFLVEEDSNKEPVLTLDLIFKLILKKPHSVPKKKLILGNINHAELVKVLGPNQVTLHKPAAPAEARVK